MATRKITVRRVKVRGAYLWRVRRWENGKPRRTFFSSKAKADAEAANLQAQADRAGTVWLSLPAAQRERLIAAHHEAESNGVDLQKAIAVARQHPNGDGPPLQEVISQLQAAKLKAGRSERYVDSGLLVILNQFAADRERMPITDLGLIDVEAFLDSKALASRATLRSRLSTLFKFAIRRGYRPDNPCDRLEPIKYQKPPPAVFSPKQFEAAWTWLRKNAPHGLSWLVLSTCCGLRPEEADKTSPREINFKEGFVKVERQTTKVRQRRVIYPRPEAMQLLKQALSLGGRQPIERSSRLRILKGDAKKRRWSPVADKARRHEGWAKSNPGLRGAIGFKVWPKDITRHTAASYWLAAGETAGFVSEMLGNSENVLKRDYKALRTRAEAKEFWDLVKRLK
jgi:site-specific recombinase XerD